MRIGINCFSLQKNIGGLRQYFHMLFKELLRTDHKNRYIFFYFEHNLAELDHLENERWKDGAILLKDQREAKHHLDKIDLLIHPNDLVLSDSNQEPFVLIEWLHVINPYKSICNDLINEAYFTKKN